MGRGRCSFGGCRNESINMEDSALPLHMCMHLYMYKKIYIYFLFWEGRKGRKEDREREMRKVEGEMKKVWRKNLEIHWFQETTNYCSKWLLHNLIERKEKMYDKLILKFKLCTPFTFSTLSACYFLMKFSSGPRRGRISLTKMLSNLNLPFVLHGDTQKAFLLSPFGAVTFF